jgi:hypothetical protein
MMKKQRDRERERNREDVRIIILKKREISSYSY